MDPKWNDPDKIKLIGLVKKFPVIWNNIDKNFGNHLVNLQIFKHICEQFDNKYRGKFLILFFYNLIFF